MNKEIKKQIIIKTIGLVLGLLAFFYPHDASKAVGISLFFDYFRTFLAAFLATALLTYKRPKMNVFVFSIISIPATVLCWVLIMLSLAPFTVIDVSDILPALLIVPLSLLLFWKKFAIMYAVTVLSIFLMNKFFNNTTRS